MANIKKLPVTYPMITSWQWHATLFSILSDDDNAKKWIFSNYIQLRCYNIQEIFTGDDMLLADIMPGSSSLKECPYLITSIMTKQQIESYTGNIIDFIIKTIDLDGYIYGVFDEARILSDYDVDYKFPHELFIYGYNMDATSHSRIIIHTILFPSQISRRATVLFQPVKIICSRMTIREQEVFMLSSRTVIHLTMMLIFHTSEIHFVSILTQWILRTISE